MGYWEVASEVPGNGTRAESPCELLDRQQHDTAVAVVAYADFVRGSSTLKPLTLKNPNSPSEIYT